MTPIIRTLENAKNTPLNVKAGMVPQLSGALQNYFQPMQFILVEKTVSGGFLVESGDALQPWTTPDGQVIQGALVKFMGVLFPKVRNLDMKKEGQRRWSGFDLYSDTQLQLKVDDCVIYNGVNNIQYRCLSKWDYSLENFIQYFLVEDYTYSGPLVPGLPK